MNMLGMLRNLDPAMEEAAASLGASPWTVFRTVTLPMLIPGFASSFLLLFVEAIADLANPLVIGGDFTVLASRAYIAVNGEYNTAAGSAYSLVLLVPALLVFILQRYWASRSSAVTVTGKPTGRVRLVRAPLPRCAKTAFMDAVSVDVWSDADLLRRLLEKSAVRAAYIRDRLQSPEAFEDVEPDVTAGRLARARNVMRRLQYKEEVKEHVANFVLDEIRAGNDAMIDTTILALIATPIAGVLGMLVAWLVVVRLKASAGLMDFLGMLGLSVPGTVLGIGYLLLALNLFVLKFVLLL